MPVPEPIKPRGIIIEKIDSKLVFLNTNMKYCLLHMRNLTKEWLLTIKSGLLSSFS